MKTILSSAIFLGHPVYHQLLVPENFLVIISLHGFVILELVLPLSLMQETQVERLR